MKKTYRAVSARHALARDLKVGETYEHEYHPSLERALIAGGHAEVVEKKPANPKEKHDG